ncbi:RRP5 protein, partial [Thinocorus orbignyianus]|nr:RRP5 protein [Thinocorus orbignyianus]
KRKKISPADENDSGIEVYYREEEEDDDQEEEAAKKKSKIKKPGEAPRLQVSTGFTWDEDMNAMDMPVLNQKEESSESEEEE